MYKVALVCEGPADRAILTAVLDACLGDYTPRVIQPPISNLGGDSGPFGGGWKGVCAWCKQEGSNTASLDTLLANNDLVIVQVDADVASDPEVDRMRGCPPPSGTTEQMRILLLGWLGRGSLPGKIVACIPSMASETWALVALYPTDPSVVPCDPPPATVCVECRTDVKQLLRELSSGSRVKLVVSQGGRLKNQAKGYVSVSARIASGWAHVTQVCSEAARFDRDLRQALNPSG